MKKDGFFYDAIHLPNGDQHYLESALDGRADSAFAVETLEPELIARLPGFQRRMQWFLDNMPGLRRGWTAASLRRMECAGCLSLVDRKQLVRMLGYMDKDEFFRPRHSRAFQISRGASVHSEGQWQLNIAWATNRANRRPVCLAETRIGAGPIWFPTNFLMIESLQKFHHYYGDGFRVECPTGSGQQMSLWEVSAEISRSLTHIFLRG
jgi:hypothetical protein